jgi:Domain of unknown function (DUF5122) beta-propeller
VDADNVYLGGTFTSINGVARSRLARLSASGAGALDMLWTPTVSDQPAVIRPRPEGIYIAGYFGNLNGAGNGYLGRVDTLTGATDPSWRSGADNWVLDVLPAVNSIFTAGAFSSIGGQPRQALARLPAAADTLFVDDFDG